MRSIKARYKNLQDKNYYWSSLVCFTEAVRGQNFSKDIINRWFNKIVDEDDYSREQRKAVLRNIYKANKDVSAPQKEKVFTPRYYSK